MYLTTSQPGPDKGPYQIKAGENLNPVKTLRMRYDAWKKTQHAANNGPAQSASPPAPHRKAAAATSRIAAGRSRR